MAGEVSGDAHDFCIYGSRHRVTFPILDADGDPITATWTGMDSNRSIDQATAAACTNEAIQIAGTFGMGYLDLTATETTGTNVSVSIHLTNTGAKDTLLSIPIVRMPVMRSGTAQAGAASTITLDSGASTTDNAYSGWYVQCSNNTPTNVLGQVRRIISYVGSTRVATVEAAWGTNPSSSTTFDLLAADAFNAAVAAEIKAKTDLIPGTQDGFTYAQMELLMASVLLGKASGLGTTTATFRALDDSQNRVSMTVDADGNRTAVITMDPSSP